MVKDGGPGVTIVAGIISRSKDMLEVAALVSADDFVYQSNLVHVLFFELVGVNVLFLLFWR